MERHLSIISSSALFKGIADSEVSALLACLNARIRTYPAGSFLFRRGDTTAGMGIVLAGSIRLEREDFWGNRNILASFSHGQSFAEVYACEPGLAFDVNVIAAEAVTVLLLDVRRLTTTCAATCEFHARLIRNLLAVIARRTHALTRKIGHVSKRSTREKLLSYLSEQAELMQSSTFSIPFNRQELADYLAVDRSAMSAELSRMQREGLIAFEKNRFEMRRTSAG